jgi:hypothetical protein
MLKTVAEVCEREDRVAAPRQEPRATVRWSVGRLLDTRGTS